MKIWKSVKRKLLMRKSPADYWRKLGCKIGGADIYHSASLGSEPYLIEIGENVRIGGGVRLITHDGGVWVLRHLKKEYQGVDLIKRIRIGDNVHIGPEAIIMPGVTIGSNCIVGCGAIVTKSVPDNSIVVGVPARVIKTVDEYCLEHQDDFVFTKGMNPEEKKNFLIANIK